MLVPFNAKYMSSVQIALEVARYELVTLNHLQVTDNGKDMWQIDTSKCIALLDEVLKETNEAAHE